MPPVDTASSSAMNHEPRKPDEKSIVVIEDDDDLRSLMVDLLKAKQFSVHGFFSVEDFFEKITPQSVDIVISDVYLSGCSGIDLLDQLQSKGFTTPVILMSGSSTPNLETLARDKGACAFLPKPFPFNSLLEIIQRYS
jgi:DNA-binding NtrC family response regulator